jgi:hypothetical protein
VRTLAERAWFASSRALGWLLRSARYSEVRVVGDGGAPRVRKRRRRRAPVLIWLGGPLSAVLGTGVRVLRRGEWEERERRLYAELYGGAVRVEADGALALPVLPGATLARLLDDAVPDTPVRTRAIALAVAALADLHRRASRTPTRWPRT